MLESAAVSQDSRGSCSHWEHIRSELESWRHPQSRTDFHQLNINLLCLEQNWILTWRMAWEMV